MDWIFGVGNKNKNDPQNISQLLGAALPPSSGSGSNDDKNMSGVGGGNPAGGGSSAPPGARSAYTFDSTALERAAAAAKELEKSSKQLFLIY